MVYAFMGVDKTRNRTGGRGLGPKHGDIFIQYYVA